jgi:hypothetical protein
MKSNVLKSNKKNEKENFNKNLVVMLFWVIALVSFGSIAHVQTFEFITKDQAQIEAEKTEAYLKKVEVKLAKLKKYLKSDYDAYGREIGMNGLDACLQYNRDDKGTCLIIYNK